MSTTYNLPQKTLEGDDEIRQKMTSKDIKVKLSYLKCQKVGKSRGVGRKLSKCLSQQLLKNSIFAIAKNGFVRLLVPV